MMRLFVPALLICAACGFAWIGLTPWLRPPTPLAVIEPSAPGEDTPLPPTPTRPVPADLGDFTNRPLFSAARRPPPPEAPGAPIEDPMADMLFGRYEIAGVVQLGDKAIAMLRDARDGTLLRIREGDRVGDADVLEITLESLTFAQGGATVVAPVAGTGAETE